MGAFSVSVLMPNRRLADNVAGNYSTFIGEEINGQNKAVDFFHSFWCELNATGKKPSRADIRPSALKQFLNRVVLMDLVQDPNRFRLKVKLIGTHVAAFYGEISGMDIDDMPNDAAAERIYNTCNHVLEHSEPVLSVTTGISKDRVHLEAYALYLPLYNEAGQIDKIMAAVDIKSLL